MQILTIALLVVSFTLGALGVIYNGTFYLLMLSCAAHAVAMAFLPVQSPSIYGVTFSLSLAYTGRRCLKHKASDVQA